MVGEKNLNLWIRSQDREKLVKCDDISIAIDSKKGYKIVGYFDKNTEYEELGFYIMKTRALEVLDEIQKIISQKYLIRFDNNLQKVADFLDVGGVYLSASGNADIRNINGTYVYEMPKE